MRAGATSYHFNVIVVVFKHMMHTSTHGYVVHILFMTYQPNCVTWDGQPAHTKEYRGIAQLVEYLAIMGSDHGLCRVPSVNMSAHKFLYHPEQTSSLEIDV